MKRCFHTRCRGSEWVWKEKSAIRDVLLSSRPNHMRELTKCQRTLVCNGQPMYTDPSSRRGKPKTRKARSLAVLVIATIACGRTGPEGSVYSLPTLRVADTLVVARGHWQVMGADVDSNGVLFVADFSNLAVHVKAPDDSAVHALGREGDGPGEFRYLHGIRRCGSGMLAYDFVLTRLTAVARDGFAGDEELPAALRLSEFVGCDSIGRRYFTKMLDDPVSPGRQRRGIRVLRHTPSRGTLDTMTMLSGTEIFVSRRWRAFRAVPFGQQTFIAVASWGPVYAENTRLALTSIEEEGGRRIVYSEESRSRPATARDREHYLQEQLHLEPDSNGRTQLRGIFAEAEWENRLPQLDRLIAGQDGVIWLRRTPAADDTVASWLAVAPNGQVPEVLLLPRTTRVMSAGKDFLTIVDELPTGEERVAVVKVAKYN